MSEPEILARQFPFLRLFPVSHRLLSLLSKPLNFPFNLAPVNPFDSSRVLDLRENGLFCNAGLLRPSSVEILGYIT